MDVQLLKQCQYLRLTITTETHSNGYNRTVTLLQISLIVIFSDLQLQRKSTSACSANRTHPPRRLVFTASPASCSPPATIDMPPRRRQLLASRNRPKLAPNFVLMVKMLDEHVVVVVVRDSSAIPRRDGGGCTWRGRAPDCHADASVGFAAFVALPTIQHWFRIPACIATNTCGVAIVIFTQLVVVECTSSILEEADSDSSMRLLRSYHRDELRWRFGRSHFQSSRP